MDADLQDKKTENELQGSDVSSPLSGRRRAALQSSQGPKFDLKKVCIISQGKDGVEFVFLLNQR